MGKIKPENLKKKRIKELMKAFELAPADKMAIVRPMIEQLSDIELDLLKLKEDIAKTGYIETYQNGSNQFGTKGSTAYKCYSAMLKNYNSIVKTLLTILPDSARQSVEDDLDDFLRGG